MLEPALDRRAPDSFPLAKPPPADPVPVPEENHAPESFAGSLPLQDSGKLLAESTAACPAQPLVRFQDQPAMPHSPALVPHHSLISAFAPQLLTLAIRASDRSQISCRIGIKAPIAVERAPEEAEIHGLLRPPSLIFNRSRASASTSLSFFLRDVSQRVIGILCEEAPYLISEREQFCAIASTSIPSPSEIDLRLRCCRCASAQSSRFQHRAWPLQPCKLVSSPLLDVVVGFQRGLHGSCCITGRTR